MGYTNVDTLTIMPVKHLAFPADRSLGRVYVREDYVRERFCGPARGQVAVPSANRVRLKVDSACCHDLSFLQLLQPDDIDALCFEGASIAPAQFEHIAHLTGLKRLHFAHCDIESNGFAAIKTLTRLETLTIWWSPVGSEIARHLSELPSLRVLDLSRTAISDPALSFLATAKVLKTLALTDSPLSDEALLNFRKMRPDIELML